MFFAPRKVKGFEVINTVSAIINPGTPATSPLVPVPNELRERHQWVCWRQQDNPSGTRPKKVPICPQTGEAAKVNDPSTWGTFEEAVAQYEKHDYDGIGFVFTQNDPYLGIDLDDCRDPNSGELASWADQLVKQLDTYTEVSPSGTGLKCFIRSTQLTKGHRSKNLEIYSQGRFFTVTGRVLPGHLQIHERDITSIPALNQLLKPTNQQRSNSQPDQHKSIPPLPISDNVILRKATSAKNGHKFRLLYEGNTSQYQGDHSSADLALCRILAFWCGPRPDRIDRLFRKSKLFRAKWDVAHHGDGRTYGEATIQQALSSQEHTYPWKSSRPEKEDASAARSPASWKRPANSQPQFAFNPVTLVEEGNQAMNELVNYMKQEYSSQERFDNTWELKIDDRHKGDEASEFCDVTLVLRADSTQFTLNLSPAPMSEELREYLESLDAVINNRHLGFSITLRLCVKNVTTIRELAKQIRRITGRGQSYPNSNWKWICRRTSDSLEKLARILTEFKRAKRNGLLPNLEPNEGLFALPD